MKARMGIHISFYLLKANDLHQVPTKNDQFIEISFKLLYIFVI